MVLTLPTMQLNLCLKSLTSHFIVDYIVITVFRVTESNNYVMQEMQRHEKDKAGGNTNIFHQTYCKMMKNNLILH